MNSRLFNILVKLRAVYQTLQPYTQPQPEPKQGKPSGPSLSLPNPGQLLAVTEKRVETAEQYLAEFRGYWGQDIYSPTLGKTEEHVAELITLESEFPKYAAVFSAEGTAVPEFKEVCERCQSVATQLLDLVQGR